MNKKTYSTLIFHFSQFTLENTKGRVKITPIRKKREQQTSRFTVSQTQFSRRETKVSKSPGMEELKSLVPQSLKRTISQSTVDDLLSTSSSLLAFFLSSERFHRVSENLTLRLFFIRFLFCSFVEV